MELSIPGRSIREFTRVFSCLTKFGDDIKIAVTPKLIKFSSCNSTVSAFGSFSFEPTVFDRFELPEKYTDSNALGLSVIGRALSAPFKSRAAASIESCEISLVEGGRGNKDSGVEAGESRLVIRLLCKHGVVKTHRLTYEICIPSYAVVNYAGCTSSWTAPARILKEWTDHFHMRATIGSNVGRPQEISFYCDEENCRITSLGDGDPLSARPVSTELIVDVDEFDRYQISGTPLIRFVLKEFKAMIFLADFLSSNMTATFQHGGSPMSLQISSDIFEAKFVLATTPQSVDEAASQEPKSEKSERTMSVQPKGSRAQQHSPSPLFRPSSQASTAREHHAEDAEDGNDDDDEYGMDDLDFGEEDFAMIDSLSQVVPSASMIIPAAKVDKRSTLLIPDSGAVRCRKVPREDSPRSEEVIIQHGTPSSSLVGGGDADQDEEEDDMYEILPSTQRDQKAKKANWNLFD